MSAQISQLQDERNILSICNHDNVPSALTTMALWQLCTWAHDARLHIQHHI